jgi:integrase
MAAIKVIKNADGSRVFGAQVRIKGFDPVYRSFSTRAECIAWRDALTTELKKQRQQGNVRPDLPGLTVAALNTAYLADPGTVNDHSERYVAQLKRSLKWWSLHYGATKVMEFGVLQQREARDTLLNGTVRGGKKRAPATVVRRLAAQRSAWRWGQAAGLVSKDHAWAPRLMPKEPRARVRYLSDTELTALLAAAKAASAVLHTAIMVSIGTGVRRGELLRLTWRDVDLERSTLRVLESKNGERRTVYLPPTTAQTLKDLKAGPVVSATHVFVRADGKPLTWDRLDKSWRAVRDAVGLVDFRWHDLRHSCASYLAQNGASLLQIGTVLGHKSAGVTMKYAHLVAGAAVTGHDKLDEKLRGH